MPHDNDRTRPENVDPRDYAKEQLELTRRLYDHPDPHVRIMAHISERQLAMMEVLTSVSAAVSELSDSVKSLHNKVDELATRQTDLERDASGKANGSWTGQHS